MRYLKFSFLLLLSHTVLCQTKYVVTSSSKQPIPYANIGVPSKNKGIVSDDNGAFSFDNISTKIQQSDTIIISAIGYDRLRISYGLAVSTDTFFIPKKTYQLSEVTITSKHKKRRTIRAGTKGFSKMAYANFSTEKSKFDVLEIGKLIDFKGDSILITDINFHIHSTSTDSALFRINFYSYDTEKKLIGENFLSTPILYNTIIKKGWNSIDISKEMVFTPSTFIVSLEFIPTKRQQPVFAFSTTLFLAENTFRRTGSNLPWQLYRSNLSLYVSGKKIK